MPLPDATLEDFADDFQRFFVATFAADYDALSGDGQSEHFTYVKDGQMRQAIALRGDPFETGTHNSRYGFSNGEAFACDDSRCVGDEAAEGAGIVFVSLGWPTTFEGEPPSTQGLVLSDASMTTIAGEQARCYELLPGDDPDAPPIKYCFGDHGELLARTVVVGHETQMEVKATEVRTMLSQADLASLEPKPIN